MEADDVCRQEQRLKRVATADAYAWLDADPDRPRRSPDAFLSALETGSGRAIAAIAVGSHASPLALAWIVAALIRVATGSATVAMTTAAGIVAPIAFATPGTNAALLVLATGAGSLVLSHVNDAGFWLVKEFFNMTVPQTLKTWTVAETIIGVAGLVFTMLLSLLV